MGGGLATPADVGLLMELGCDGVFVGSGIFKGENPAQRASAMVAACTHYKSPLKVAEASTGLGKAMVGLLEHENPASVAGPREAVPGRGAPHGRERRRRHRHLGPLSLCALQLRPLLLW